MNYTAHPELDASERAARTELLGRLGAGGARAQDEPRRSRCASSRRRAEVSERFLVQLETGAGNISVARLEDIAERARHDARPSSSRASPRGDGHAARREVVAAARPPRRGQEHARRPRSRDAWASPSSSSTRSSRARRGCRSPTIFEMHGEAYFRNLEREVLRTFLDAAPQPASLATGGSHRHGAGHLRAASQARDDRVAQGAAAGPLGPRRARRATRGRCATAPTR